MPRLVACCLLLIVLAGCAKQPIVIEDLTKFGAQGPGASSPEELVSLFQTAVKQRDLEQLQQLVFAKDLTDARRSTLNAQFQSLINKGIEQIRYLDDLATLKEPAIAELAWYVYQPEKHEALMEAAQAEIQKQVDATIAAASSEGKNDAPATPQTIQTLVMPADPGDESYANVQARGVLLVTMPNLGKTPGRNQLAYLVGVAPQGAAYYLGVVVQPIPEPESETPPEGT